jgi:hypothetical protein
MVGQEWARATIMDLKGRSILCKVGRDSTKRLIQLAPKQR